MLIYEIVNWHKAIEPQSLTRFLAKSGGLRDDTFSRRINTPRGRHDARNRPSDLRSMDAHLVPGLIKARLGMSLDDAAVRAWEEGYFPEHREPPEINDLLAAIDDDIRGNKHYSMHDEQKVAAHHAAMSYNADLDRYGSPEYVAGGDRTRDREDNPPPF